MSHNDNELLSLLLGAASAWAHYRMAEGVFPTPRPASPRSPDSKIASPFYLFFSFHIKAQNPPNVPGLS